MLSSIVMFILACFLNRYRHGFSITCSFFRLCLGNVLLQTGISQSAGRGYFSEKVALFCINLEASRGVKIWRGITTFILHFNWFYLLL